MARKSIYIKRFVNQAMLHRTGSRKLHTAKKLTPPYQNNGKGEGALEGNGLVDMVAKEGQKDDASMKQAFLEMDGTIINSSGPTFGDYMTKR